MIIKRTADGEIAIILTQQEIQEMNTLLSTPTLFPTESIVNQEDEVMKGRETKTRNFLKALREEYGHTPFTFDDYQFRRLRVEYEIWDPSTIFRSLQTKNLVILTFGETGRIHTITLNWF